MAKLSHYGKHGEIRMVDVSAKPATARAATARGFVRMSRKVMAAIGKLSGKKGAASGTPAMRKGNPLEIARIAGIAAAKRTSEWIPLCHPLPLTHIDVRARVRQNGVEVTATVKTTAPTGVEMEALTAVAAAALTLYDMCKALDKSMEITGIVLVEKTGGRSGRYRRARPRRARRP